MVTGRLRLNKFSPKMDTLYQSVIEVSNLRLEDLTNKILHDSYQISGTVCVSEQCVQSLLLLRLPHHGSFGAGSAKPNTLV